MTALAAREASLPLRRALAALDWLVAKLVIGAMAAMVVIVAAQVFLRYVLNISLDWAEELSRLVFIWAVFLAIALGIKRGAHVGISLLTERLPDKLRDRLFRAINALAVVLMAIVAYEAAILTRDQWDEPMATLDYSVGLFMLPLCIGATHSILHLLHAALAGPAPKQMVPVE